MEKILVYCHSAMKGHEFHSESEVPKGGFRRSLFKVSALVANVITL